MQSKKDLSKSSNNGTHHLMDAFTNLEHKIENMFHHIWHKPHDEERTEFSVPVAFNAFPKMDVIDRDKEVIVKAELPGIEKDDIDISISNNRLLIKAMTRHEEKEEKGDFIRQEIRSSEVYRSVQLPGEVDDSKAKTSFKNGLLVLTLPKHESSHRKHIKVD